VNMATAYQWAGQSGEFRAARQGRTSEAVKPPLVPRRAASTRRKKPAMVEFYTVKKIDNSRLVRHVEPVKLRKLYRTLALGGIIAAFCMLYIYQHFRCIDLSFQLEDLKGKQELAQAENGKLKLAIAYLRDPHRIDVIARHQLGLTQPTASQVREYASIDGAEVAAVQYVRPNRAP
jgi:cell division protein FtsL